MSTHQSFLCKCLCLHSEPQQPPPTPPPQETLQYQLMGLAQPLMRSVFLEDPGAHYTLWAPSNSGVSVFPNPVNFLRSNAAAFKARFSGCSSFCYQSPRLGSLMWGSGLSLLWENFCGVIIFQFVGCPLSRYGICFYCDCAPPTLLLWFLCLLDVGYLFCRFQLFFVNGCSAVSCDFGVFVRRHELTSFYSAILPARPSR